MKKTKVLGSMTSLLMVFSMFIFVFMGCEGKVEVTPKDVKTDDGVVVIDDGEIIEGELVIISVEGNGSQPDIFIDEIIIFGANFGVEPDVKLIFDDSQTFTLDVIESNDEAIRARLPDDLNEGEYKLVVSNLAGEASEDVKILRGEKGEKGDTGPQGEGVNSLISVTDEPVGDNCADGGKKIESGLDNGDGNGNANNGVLESGEVDNTSYVCVLKGDKGDPGEQGTTGDQGPAGYISLVSISDEAAGANCADGGKKVEAGIDNGEGGGTAGNGVLEAGEVDSTSYVCNGAQGVQGDSGQAGEGINSLISIIDEQAGSNCVNGGKKIQVGLDNGDVGGTVNNGILEEGEIDEISYICNISIGSGGNNPPYVTSTPNIITLDNKQYYYKIDATDPEGNYPLSFSLVGYPDGMTIDNNTGEVYWIPPFSKLGNNIVIVQIADSLGVSSYHTFTIEVTTSWETFLTGEEISTSYSTEINFITSDNIGNLWMGLGSMDGVCEYDGDEFYIYDYENFGLGSVSSIGIDSHNNKWFSS